MDDGGFSTVAFFWLKDAGFVDDARKLVDNGLAVELFGVSDADEGKMSALEKLFHIFWIAARGAVDIGAIVKFNDADWAQGALVTKDKISGLVFDKTVSFVAVLATDFMAEESIEANAGDDVEFLAKNIVEELETVFFGTYHKMLFGAETETIDGVATTVTSSDGGKN